MARRKHTPEQVINKLRQAEVAIAEGCTMAEASRQIGVTQQTFYRWRAEYWGSANATSGAFWRPIGRREPPRWSTGIEAVGLPTPHPRRRLPR